MKNTPFVSVAVCAVGFLLSACSHDTTEEQAHAIRNNLKQYYLAGQQYLLSSGKPEARFADLVGKDKYLLPLKSANGEQYEGLVVTQGTKSLSVKAADGKEITFSAP